MLFRSGDAYIGGIIGYNGVSIPAVADAKERIKELLNEVAPALPLSTVEPFAPATSVTEDVAVVSNVQTTIWKSINYGNIEGYRYLGGIIGLNSDDSVLNILECDNLKIGNTVEGGQVQVRLQGNPIIKNPALHTIPLYYAGGITGRNSISGVVQKCRNTGNVISPSQYVGGLIEVNEGVVLEC